MSDSFREFLLGALHGKPDYADPVAVLENLTVAQAIARPHENLASIWEQLAHIKFWLDHTPSDTTDTILLVSLMPLEDFDAQTDTIDAPPEYYRALKFKLALDLAPEFGVEPGPNLDRNASEALAACQSFAPEYSDLYFEPGRDD